MVDEALRLLMRLGGSQSGGNKLRSARQCLETIIAILVPSTDDLHFVIPKREYTAQDWKVSSFEVKTLLAFRVGRWVNWSP